VCVEMWWHWRKNTVFCRVTPFSLVKMRRHFEGIWRLHFQYTRMRDIFLKGQYSCNRTERDVTAGSPFYRVPEHDSSIAGKALQNVQ
jgi:hypothetical protein